MGWTGHNVEQSLSVGIKIPKDFPKFKALLEAFIKKSNFKFARVKKEGFYGSDSGSATLAWRSDNCHCPEPEVKLLETPDSELCNNCNLEWEEEREFEDDPEWDELWIFVQLDSTAVTLCGSGGDEHAIVNDGITDIETFTGKIEKYTKTIKEVLSELEVEMKPSIFYVPEIWYSEY